MKTTYHIPIHEDHPTPKRGDLFQSNLGKRTERTWFILCVRELAQKTCPEMGGVLTRRWKIWAERWWVLDTQTRQRLFRSAERAGGQIVHPFQRFPAKRRTVNFEQLMGAR